MGMNNMLKKIRAIIILLSNWLVTVRFLESIPNFSYQSIQNNRQFPKVSNISSEMPQNSVSPRPVDSIFFPICLSNSSNFKISDWLSNKQLLSFCFQFSNSFLSDILEQCPRPTKYDIHINILTDIILFLTKYKVISKIILYFVKNKIISVNMLIWISSKHNSWHITN